MNSTPCIGILKETKSAWERRVALTPNGCKDLIDMGIKVKLEPSRIRCFSDDEYLAIGAEITTDLSDCNLIISIQEPQVNSLMEEKTYIFFSHTKKGKTDNQGLLEKILEKKIRLVDYECIKEDVEDKSLGKRLVSFGRIAGIAGTINILKGIGELLLARQVSTPFVFTKLAYMYSDVVDALQSLVTLGQYITEQYLPVEYSPFTFAVLGNGQVSSGVQEALKCLPHKFIKPSDLINGNYEKRRDLIYIVVFNLEDLYEKISIDGEYHKFDRAEFIKSPELYTCIFERYIIYFQCIINCLYWESRYPKIITKKQLKYHFSKHDCKLIGVSDISCDLLGAIDVLKKYTKFTKPFFIYEPVLEKNIVHVDSATKEGIIYTAIPNLAASFPTDASEHFCSLLLPYIKNLALSKYPIKFEDQTDLCNELRNAVVSSNGILTPFYRNTFRNIQQEKMLQEKSSQDHANKPYVISLKMKGHLFDSGFFTILINSFPDYNLSHKINFLSIGEHSDISSILYFDAFATTKDELKQFMKLVYEKVDEYKLEMDVLKSNIN